MKRSTQQKDDSNTGKEGENQQEETQKRKWLKRTPKR
jgi:hypothetical protein